MVFFFSTSPSSAPFPVFVFCRRPFFFPASLSHRLPLLRIKNINEGLKRETHPDPWGRAGEVARQTLEMKREKLYIYTLTCEIATPPPPSSYTSSSLLPSTLAAVTGQPADVWTRPFAQYGIRNQ